MIEAASCEQVSRNELTPGGTVAAISAIKSSGMGPGPLGIADTSPIAEAPASIAIHASSMPAMQQIFTRGFVVGFILLCAISVHSVSLWSTFPKAKKPQRHRVHRDCTEKK